VPAFDAINVVLVWCARAAFLMLALPSAASAQVTTQLWGHLTLDWIRSHHVTYQIDVEPKVLLSAPEGDPGWASLEVTPHVEYGRGPWFDVIGELAIAETWQTDDLNSTDLTPRIGMWLHLLANVRDLVFREKQPRRRLVLRDLVRVEWRNISYSDGRPRQSTTRFRNRLEASWPLTRQRITENGAVYLVSDWEWFIPLDDPDERFANRQRIRGGIGYRRSFAWRFEAHYVWNRSRNTIDEEFTTSDHCVDLRLKRVW
jgi:hypothetical protein